MSLFNTSNLIQRFELVKQPYETKENQNQVCIVRLVPGLL